MPKKKIWILLSCAFLPVRFTGAQIVDLKAEVEVGNWGPKGVKTRTTAVNCVVGTNYWRIDGDFGGNATVIYSYTGTNIVQDSVITKDISEEIRAWNRRGLPYITAPALGTRSELVFESVDGNPAQGRRGPDHMTMVARAAWLAFCSGPCLKREARQIFPPSELWKELVCADHFVDRTQIFEDALGLPETMDLDTTNDQTIVQYRVTSSTNLLGWQFPLTFELAQYRPAPVPGLPNVTMGTNGWELQFIAKGKVSAMKISAK